MRTRLIVPFLFISFILLIALFPFFHSSEIGDAFAQQKKNDGFAINYTVKVVDPEKHLVSVRGVFSNCPARNIILNFFDPYRVYVGTITIEEVKAACDAGSRLAVGRDGSSYRIALTPGMKNFTLEYSIKMNQMHNIPVKGPTGYLCKSYMLTRTAWSLLMPENVDAEKYSLKLELPTGWMPVVPWDKEGDRFVTDDPRVFKETTYAAGLFEIRRKNILGTEVTVAADSHFDQHFRERLFANAFTTFEFIKSAFKADCPRTHLSVFTKAEGENEWQSFNEHGLSQGEAVSTINNAMYQFTHRIFHTFNAFYPCGMAIEPLWFMEGTNQYYDYLAMMNAKTEMPLASLSNFCHNEYKKKHTRLDSSLAAITTYAGSWEKVDFLVYQKGALASLLLDLEIRHASKGRASMSDVLAELYGKFGKFQGGTITNAHIEAAASKAAGASMKSFFDQYICGRAPYNLDALFADDDRDGISNAAEKLIGTNLASADSDGDRYSDWFEYHQGTDPLSAASKPMETIAVDGFQGDWEGVKAQEFDDSAGDSSCATDIVKVRWRAEGPHLYFLMKLKCLPEMTERPRYFLNLDIDGDGFPDYNFGVMWGTLGDCAKFRKDYSTYDHKQIDEIDGLAAVGEVVEFKIPASVITNPGKAGAYMGIWDTKKNAVYDMVELKISR